MSGLDRLLARRPVAVLEELEALAVRARAGEPVALPALTLLLQGGHRLHGRFLAFDAARAGPSIALDVSEARGAMDAAYVGLEAVVSLVVHHDPRTVAPLSGGRVEPPAGPAPGKLALDRAAAELLAPVGLPSSVDWDSLGGATDAARAAVHQAVEALRSALGGVLGDAMGRQALLDRVASLRVAGAREAGPQLAERALVVGLAREGDRVRGQGSDALRAAIERLL